MNLLLSNSFLMFALLWQIPCAKAEKNILVFGDSLSAAYGIPREAGWVNLLQLELKRIHSQYSVVNASVSGETTSGGLRRLSAALAQYRPAIVILELGANDGLRGIPLTEIKANLTSLILQSRQAEAQILLLGMQLPPNYGGGYTAGFRTMYAELAQQYRTTWIPFLLEGISAQQFQADNLHPIAEAQPHIMIKVMNKLKLLLH